MPRKTKWRPHAIEVSVSKSGCIRIAQEDPERNFSQNGEIVVIVDTDDADQLAAWIQEVKAEIVEAKIKGESFGDDEEEN
jgi:hypothetical protein